MSFDVRPGRRADLPAIDRIYAHYVHHTHITFDVQPPPSSWREAWFEAFEPEGPHQLLVGLDPELIGFAYSRAWRSKPAYGRTVETTIYLDDDAVGKGYGRTLYTALFEALALEDVHRAVAGIALPNAASIGLHQAVGFQRVGVFHAVGHKFGKYWDVAWYERAMR